MSGDMIDSYLSPKFGFNPLDGFSESDVYGRTTDARVTTVALLCSSTKSQKLVVLFMNPNEISYRFSVS